jgi:hypothetical protein
MDVQPQQPFAIVNEILTYVSAQLGIPAQTIEAYQQRRQTIAEHQQLLRLHLGVSRFGETEITTLEKFLFEEACQLEQTGPLLIKAKEFLGEQGILQPADDTLAWLIARQRERPGSTSLSGSPLPCHQKLRKLWMIC